MTHPIVYSKEVQLLTKKLFYNPTVSTGWHTRLGESYFHSSDSGSKNLRTKVWSISRDLEEIWGWDLTQKPGIRKIVVTTLFRKSVLLDSAEPHCLAPVSTFDAKKLRS